MFRLLFLEKFLFPVPAAPSIRMVAILSKDTDQGLSCHMIQAYMSTFQNLHGDFARSDIWQEWKFATFCHDAWLQHNILMYEK